MSENSRSYKGCTIVLEPFQKANSNYRAVILGPAAEVEKTIPVAGKSREIAFACAARHIDEELAWRAQQEEKRKRRAALGLG